MQTSIARARASDPATSHQAAERVNFAPNHFALIYAALKLHGPKTIYALSENTGLSHVQVARRTAEMHSAGLIEPSGETRAGPSGRQCRVWRVT